MFYLFSPTRPPLAETFTDGPCATRAGRQATSEFLKLLRNMSYPTTTLHNMTTEVPAQVANGAANGDIQSLWANKYRGVSAATHKVLPSFRAYQLILNRRQ